MTFDTNNVQFAIPIDIVDDEIQELDENFFVFLTTSNDNVILDPGHTTVQITRDVGMSCLSVHKNKCYNIHEITVECSLSLCSNYSAKI